MFSTGVFALMNWFKIFAKGASINRYVTIEKMKEIVRNEKKWRFVLKWSAQIPYSKLKILNSMNMLLQRNTPKVKRAYGAQYRWLINFCKGEKNWLFRIIGIVIKAIPIV